MRAQDLQAAAHLLGDVIEVEDLGDDLVGVVEVSAHPGPTVEAAYGCLHRRSVQRPAD
jgi:hypothetical protein